MSKSTHIYAVYIFGVYLVWVNKMSGLWTLGIWPVWCGFIGILGILCAADDDVKYLRLVSEQGDK